MEFSIPGIKFVDLEKVQAKLPSDVEVEELEPLFKEGGTPLWLGDVIIGIAENLHVEEGAVYGNIRFFAQIECGFSLSPGELHLESIKMIFDEAT